jgi:hypothetical protein
MRELAPLWTCPRCGRTFANRNQTHSCGRQALDDHFRNKPAEVRALYDAFVEALEALGPVEVLPEKTRIAFHVRMSFAQVTPRRRWLDGHLVMPRRHESSRFRSVQTLGPRSHVHFFRLLSPAEIDDEFRALLSEAYAAGEQRHLRRSGTSGGADQPRR